MSTSQHATIVAPAHVRLSREKTVGCYALDEQGRHWASWSGSAVACAVCGLAITHGWTRALSEEYVCDGHVEWIPG